MRRVPVVLVLLVFVLVWATACTVGVPGTAVPAAPQLRTVQVGGAGVDMRMTYTCGETRSCERLLDSASTVVHTELVRVPVGATVVVQVSGVAQVSGASRFSPTCWIADETRQVVHDEDFPPFGGGSAWCRWEVDG
jgi:hypothetical protein